MNFEKFDSINNVKYSMKCCHFMKIELTSETVVRILKYKYIYIND